MDENVPKSRRLTGGQTGDIGTCTKKHIRVRKRQKCVLYIQQAVNVWSFGRDNQGFFLCDGLTIFGSTLKDRFVSAVKDNYWDLHGLSYPIASIDGYKNQTIR